MKTQNMASFAPSTIAKAKQFQSGLEELQKDVPLHIVREYLINKRKPYNISEDILHRIDSLQSTRKSAIIGEMQHASSQAAQYGLDLPKEITSGESLVPGFSEDVLSKIPSLTVYNYFSYFTKEELEQYLNNLRSDSKNNSGPRVIDEDDIVL